MFGVYAVFVAGMIFMIYSASKVALNLESKDYYQQDLNYQNRMDRMANSASLQQKLRISYRAEDQEIEIDYPKTLHDFTGSVTLFRPSNSHFDKTYKVQSETAKPQIIDVSDLLEGMWKIKVLWQAGNRKFYDESVIMIKP